MTTTITAPAMVGAKEAATFTAPAMKGAKHSAAYCGIGRSLFLSLVSTGKAPKPVRLGRRTLWRVADLEAWIAAGCGKWEC